MTSFRRDSALVRTAGEPGRKVAPEEIAGPVAVLSGIAQPAAFEAGLRRRLPDEPVLAIRCSDHVDYGPSLVARIDRALADSPAATLITTAKDWIKLAPFWRSDVEVLVAELEIVWGDGKTLPQLVEERLDSVPAGEP